MKNLDMKLYGYTASSDTLLEMREVTFRVDSVTAQKLGEFFLQCAQEMRSVKNWEHEHFNGDSSPDVVVFNSKAGVEVTVT
jgi:hypothetical protein